MDVYLYMENLQVENIHMPYTNQVIFQYVFSKINQKPTDTKHVLRVQSVLICNFDTEKALHD